MKTRKTAHTGSKHTKLLVTNAYKPHMNTEEVMLKY